MALRGDLEEQLDAIAASFPKTEGEDTDDLTGSESLSEPLLLRSDILREHVIERLACGAQFWTPTGIRLHTLEEVALAFEITGKLLAVRPARAYRPFFEER